MHYVVTHTRSVGDRRSRVVGRTRRYNGAVNVRDALVDSARDHALKHADGARVVVGPTDVPDAVAVVTVRASGDLVDTYAVVRD